MFKYLNQTSMRSNSILNRILILLGIILITTYGCTKDIDNGNNAPTIGDETFYKNLAYAISLCYADIYNQNLAGHSTGTYNKTVNGPMGGTVRITGNISATSSATTFDLVFSMSDVNYFVKKSGYSTNITLSGITTHTGTTIDNKTNVNHQADSLHVKGAVMHDNINREIDNIGEVRINRSFSRISANIFGYTVSW